MSSVGRARKLRPEDSTALEEKKKLRNRLSQQAFRKRQNAYIQELERRMEQTGKSDNERIVALEEENQELRRQLVSFVNKAQSAAATLQALTAAMNQALRGSKDDDREQESEDISGHSAAEPPPTAPTSSLSHQDGTVDLDDTHHIFDVDLLGADLLTIHDLASLKLEASATFLDAEQYDVVNPAAPNYSLDVLHPLSDESTPFDRRNQTALVQSADKASPGRLHVVRNPSFQAPTAESIHPLPGVWSYHYQMGSPVYSHAIANLELVPSRLTPSNSYFSDHVAGLRRCLQEKWCDINLSQASPLVLNRLNLSVSLMLSIFNSISRPLAMAWYSPTKFYYHIADLTMWQMNPTREMYTRLHPRYRPSALQLTETYPSVIDWCPFSVLRDKLILLHAANPFLDQIICDIATAYVVETDLSTLVRLDAPTLGYVRVWDLIRAMGEKNLGHLNPSSRGSRWPLPSEGQPQYRAPVSASRNATTGAGDVSLPAPSVEALFHHEGYARLAFKKLRMDDGVAIYKIDPNVFDKYPELYDSDVNVLASGTPLAPVRQESIPPPTPLDESTLHIYTHFADWAFDAISHTGM